MGSSIPLVALQQPPQWQAPRTPLEEASRAAELQQQQAALAQQKQQTAQQGQAFPVQQQQRQATLEQTQQENQARAQQLKDRQILGQVMTKHVLRDDSGKVTGFDTQAAANEAIQSGASPGAVTDFQQKYNQGVKSNLDLTEQQHKQQQENLDRFGGMLEDIQKVDDPKARQTAWEGALLEGHRRGVDIGQFPPTAPSNDGIKQLEIPLGIHAQVLADAKTQSEIQKNLRGPVDQQELNSYLSSPQVKGEPLPPAQRTPASFLAWKAKQNPQFMMMGNQLQGNALDQAAQRYSQTGELPGGLSRSPGSTLAIINRAGELNPDQSIAGNKAVYNSTKNALSQLQTQASKVDAFESTAGKNLDLFLKQADKVTDLGVKFADVPIRMVQRNVLGTADMAAFDAARTTALTEIAKVLNSPTGAGVLSDSARKEAEGLIGPNATLNSIKSAAKILRQDMANRHQSYQDEISGLQQKLGVGQGGQKQMIRARDPQGILHEAPAGTPLPQGWKQE